MKILFITSNRLGDAVLSTGVLNWLVEKYPRAHFTIACGPHAAGLFRAVPRLERLITLHKKKGNAHWFDLWTRCVTTRWDITVDLRNSLVTRLLFAKKKFYRARGSGGHKVIDNARVIAANPPPAPRIWIDAPAEREAAHLLPTTRPILALGPAANWFPKQWPVENFVALAHMLTNENGPLTNACVLVIVGENEREIVKPFLKELPSDRCVPLIGHDLLTIAACLQECCLYVGNDSGLMHMAAATGISVLGLFGPGEEDVYGPWGGQVVRTPENRQELLARLVHPGASQPNLMASLDIDVVYRAAYAILKETNI